MRYSLLRSIAPALALAAAGCVSLLPEPAPAPRLYVLSAADDVPRVQGQPSAAVIAVAAPHAPRALSGADIAWRKDGRIAYADGAAWTGRTVDLLQMLTIHTIDRRGGVLGAVRAGEARADLEVRMDVLAFEVDEDGGLDARFNAQVKLFDARTRTLRDTMEIDERVALRDRSAGAAARALEQASRQGALKIADWAAAAAQPPAPKPAPDGF